MKPADVFRLTTAVLFDFDGPICALFANYHAEVIAAELVELIATRGGRLPDDVSGGPVTILPWLARHEPGLLPDVETALCAAELRAAASAEPTPDGHRALEVAAGTGRPVGIVSNNSADALAAYLNAHGLADHARTVVGRPFARPDRMKPEPALVLQTAAELGVPPGECVLIGDSIADIGAARAAGCRSVGYARWPGWDERLAAAGADAVVDDMGEIVTALGPWCSPG